MYYEGERVTNLILEYGSDNVTISNLRFYGNSWLIIFIRGRAGI
jgi:hypothetical protein